VSHELTVSHRVAIAGRVFNQAGKPVGGAEVVMQAVPPAFKGILALAALRYGSKWKSLPARPDRSITRDDGLFYFVDLPNGKYTLRASLSASGKRFGTVDKSVTVARDAKGNIKTVFVEISLPATALKGIITRHDGGTGIPMAEVRIRGSGERVYSDSQGRYELPAIEPGKRTLLVFAQGYRKLSQVVEIEPAREQTADCKLKKE